jgi:Transmembrane protein 43
VSPLATLIANRRRSSAAAGAVLLLLGLLLLGTTEHTDRLRAMGEDALGGFVLTGAAAKPGPASNGQLVLAAGAPVVGAPATDTQFDVSVAAPALVRKVEMFQWNETDYGGQRNYELEWFDHPIDSSRFTDPSGHANPGAFPLVDERFNAPDVMVDGFKLAPALVDAIAGVENYSPDLSHLPPNMAATFQAHDGVLLSSSDPTRPQVGDLRIRWMEVAPAHLSVLARDDGGTLVQTNDASGKPLAEVELGRRSLTDMLTDAPQPPPFKWTRRILAMLLAWAGAWLLLVAARRRDVLLALLIALAPLASLAGAYWLGVRNPVAIALIALALAALLGAGWRWRTADASSPRSGSAG